MSAEFNHDRQHLLCRVFDPEDETFDPPCLDSAARLASDTGTRLPGVLA